LANFLAGLFTVSKYNLEKFSLEYTFTDSRLQGDGTFSQQITLLPEAGRGVAEARGKASGDEHAERQEQKSGPDRLGTNRVGLCDLGIPAGGPGDICGRI
jgi:hypothetical protein